MPIDEVLAAIDVEIAKLEQARTLLSGGSAQRTRTANASKQMAVVIPKQTAKKKRRMSAEARARIAEAQRKRWAAFKAKKSK